MKQKTDTEYLPHNAHIHLHQTHRNSENHTAKPKIQNIAFNMTTSYQ